MEDQAIIDLYFARSEIAIAETEQKFGNYCRTIAGNILRDGSDSEECVSDTWLRAWNAIPPQRPARLGTFLGRITRNLALDRWRARTSQSRGGGAIPEELDECLTAGDPTQTMTDRVVLTQVLDRFLEGLPPKKRKLFLRRYWYFSTVEELSRDFGMSRSNVKMTLLRLRRELKELLIQEGIEP